MKKQLDLSLFCKTYHVSSFLFVYFMLFLQVAITVKSMFVSGRSDMTSQSQFRYIVLLLLILRYVLYSFFMVLTTSPKNVPNKYECQYFYLWEIDLISNKNFPRKIIQIDIWNELGRDKKLTVLTETISTINLNKPCDTQSLNLALGRQPKLFPSISENSSLTPDSVKCSPSPTLRLNRTLEYTKSI